LLALELSVRDSADQPLTSVTNRTAEVSVGEVVYLEVSYRDLRPSGGAKGAAALATSIQASQATAFDLVLTETQFLIVGEEIAGAASGSISASLVGQADTYESQLADFVVDPIAEIVQGLVQLGLEADQFAVRQLRNGAIMGTGRPATAMDFIFEVRYSFEFDGVDVPDIQLTPNLDIPVFTETISVAPYRLDGTVNPRAISRNIDVRSRSLPAADSFGTHVYADFQFGQFDVGTGTIQNEVVGFYLENSLLAAFDLTELPSPFDAFSIPVRITEAIEALEFQLSVSNSGEIVMYGMGEALGAEQVLIDGLSSVIITASVPANHPPVVIGPIDRRFHENEAQQVVDLLASVSDPDGDLLFVQSIALVDGDASGLTLDLQGGSISIDPSQYSWLRQGQSEVIRYSIAITDGFASVQQQATFTILGVNEPPIAIDDTFVVSGSQQNNFNVLANDIDLDGDAFFVTSVTSPSVFGRIALGADGSIFYTPAVGFLGVETFFYTITDGLDFATARVSVTVEEADPTDSDPPQITSIRRQNPMEIRTSSDQLEFLVLFTEDVTGIDATDFLVVGTSAIVTSVVATIPSQARVTIAGGDLAELNGRVSLEIAEEADIEDLFGNRLSIPTNLQNAEYYDVRNGDNVALLTTVTSSLNSGTTAGVVIRATEPSRLNGWLDFNRDGTYQAQEKIFDGAELLTGRNVLAFNVPPGSSVGNTIAEFRWTPIADPGSVTVDIEERQVLISDAGAGSVNVRLDESAVVTWQINDDQFEVMIADQIVYRSPADPILHVSLVGSKNDDRFLFSSHVDGFDGVIEIDGGMGVDSIELRDPQSELDLASERLSRVRGIEAIRLNQQSSSTLALTALDLMSLPGGGSQLRVELDPDDRLALRSSGFRLESTLLSDGKLIASFVSAETGLTVAGLEWTNPVNPLDTNGSGDISPLDALVVINELNRKRFVVGNSSILVDPASIPTEFPGIFYDVSHDGSVTPLDALRVINQLNRGTGANLTAVGGGMPGTSIKISGQDFDPASVTMVTFRDDQGYRITLPASDVSSASISAPIPIWLDQETLETRSASVEVVVTQIDSNGKQTRRVAGNPIQIEDLPRVDLPAGSLTRTFFQGLESLIEQTVLDAQTVADASDGAVQIDPVLQSLQDAAAQYRMVVGAIDSLVTGSVEKVELGSALTAGGPVDAFLDIDGLVQFDRMLAAWVLGNSSAEREGEGEGNDLQASLLNKLDQYKSSRSAEVRAELSQFRDHGSAVIALGTVAGVAVAPFVAGASIVGVVQVGALIGTSWLVGVTIAGAIGIAETETHFPQVIDGNATQPSYAETRDFLASGAWNLVRDRFLGKVLPQLVTRSSTGQAAVGAVVSAVDSREALIAPNGTNPSIGQAISDNYETIQENLSGDDDGISVSVNTLSFDVPKGGEETMTETIVVSNGNDQPIEISISSSATELMVSPASVVVPANGTLEITVTLEQRAYNKPLQDSPQVFEYDIELTNADGDTVESIGVQVTVTAGEVTPSADEIEIIVPPDGTGEAFFSLTNTGPTGSVSQFELTSDPSGRINIFQTSGSTQSLPVDNPAEFRIEVQHDQFDANNVPTDWKLIVTQTDFVVPRKKEIAVRLVVAPDIAGIYTGQYSGVGSRSIVEDGSGEGTTNQQFAGTVTLEIADVAFDSRSGFLTFGGTGSLTGLDSPMSGPVNGFYDLVDRRIVVNIPSIAGLAEPSFVSVYGLWENGRITGAGGPAADSQTNGLLAQHITVGFPQTYVGINLGSVLDGGPNRLPITLRRSQ
jgi:hypothetical protein